MTLDFLFKEDEWFYPPEGLLHYTFIFIGVQ
jgi:hypothetical protein